MSQKPTFRKPGAGFEPLDFTQRSTRKPVSDDPAGDSFGAAFTHSTSPIDELLMQRSQSSGTLRFSPNSEFELNPADLVDMGVVGEGAFGTVIKMKHKASDRIMAVKTIRSTVDNREQKNLLKELGTLMCSDDYPHIVQFYGAIFKEGQCWICMELMDTSLENLYKDVFKVLEQRLPEPLIGKITHATVLALNYLKDEHKIIHRDVKPSNILLDSKGQIKLCDFGIAGQLVDSIAKTRDAGCRPYMAPERLSLQNSSYGIRSDVWSLGITLVEVATGKFPYPAWGSPFEQLNQVVHGDPPILTPGEHFSLSFVQFVNRWLLTGVYDVAGHLYPGQVEMSGLAKEEQQRPVYHELLTCTFLQEAAAAQFDVASYVAMVLDQTQLRNKRQQWTTFEGAS